MAIEATNSAGRILGGTGATAKWLGVSEARLSHVLRAHPELKPEARVGGKLLWFEADAERAKSALRAIDEARAEVKRVRRALASKLGGR